MRVVGEAVEDGVGVSGIANNLMPGGQGELGGDDRRSAPVSLLEDFEQIVTGDPADRAYGSVLGSAARLTMIEEAAKARFRWYPKSPFEKALNAVCGRDSSLGCGPQRRAAEWPRSRRRPNGI